MNPIFLFAFLALSQAFERIPIVAGPSPIANRTDGTGNDARFLGTGPMWVLGSDLYFVDGEMIRKVNLDTREVSTVTARAGTGVETRDIRYPQHGLQDLWGEGFFLYATDIGSGLIRQIDVRTGEVENFSSGGPVPWGLTGRADQFFVANPSTREIVRVDRSRRTREKFVELAPPFDPHTCVGGSDCIGYYVPAPRDLWSDGTYIYATGFNKAVRRIEIATASVSSLPEIPVVPVNLWGDSTHLYIASAAEIGRQDLQTGAYQTLAPLGLAQIFGYDGGIYALIGSELLRIDIETREVTSIAGRPYFVTRPTGVVAMWAVSESLFTVVERTIRRVDVATGRVTIFAGGGGQIAGFVDGIGTEARFYAPQGLWGNDTHLYVGDGEGIRRIDLKTAEVTTLTGVPYENFGRRPVVGTELDSVTALWGSGEHLYVLDSLLKVIHKVHIHTGEVSTFAGTRGLGGSYVDGPGLTARFFQPSAMWSDGTFLYVTDRDRIRTVSIATSEVQTLFTGVGGNSIWADKDYFYLAADSLVRMSRSTGAFEFVPDAGNGPRKGFPLSLSRVTGNGRDLFASDDSSIWRLEPRPLPTETTFRVQAAAQSFWSTRGDKTSLSLGYATIDSETDIPSGTAIYSYRKDGILVSETSVPLSSPVREGRMAATFRGGTVTGLAIANPNDAPADIDFHFTDSNGFNFGGGTVRLLPRQQIARFLDETPFSVPGPFGPGFLRGDASFEGTFTFRSSIPVGAIALRGLANERQEFLMTTLPISPLSGIGNLPAIIPQYATGGGWKTEVILVNPGDSQVSGLLEFGTRMPYTIPPRSSRVFTSTESDSITAGAVWITPIEGVTPSAVAVFSFRKDGNTVVTTGVPAVKSAKAFEIFAPAAFAIANPGESTVTVRVESFESDGTANGRFGVVSIPAKGHVALFLHEVPHASLAPYTRLFRSASRVRLSSESDSAISVTGLRTRYNERGDFLVTATPALADDVPVNEGLAILPHFADGGGYTTQFVLLNRVVAGVAEGKVRYFSQSGEPIAIPFR